LTGPLHTEPVPYTRVGSRSPSTPRGVVPHPAAIIHTHSELRAFGGDGGRTERDVGGTSHAEQRARREKREEAFHGHMGGRGFRAPRQADRKGDCCGAHTRPQRRKAAHRSTHHVSEHILTPTISMPRPSCHTYVPKVPTRSVASTFFPPARSHHARRAASTNPTCFYYSTHGKWEGCVKCRQPSHCALFARSTKPTKTLSAGSVLPPGEPEE
jgi:hypothetical protein